MTSQNSDSIAKAIDDLVWYCHKAMESDGMLFESQQVPIDDIEYAADQIKRGINIRKQARGRSP